MEVARSITAAMGASNVQERFKVDDQMIVWIQVPRVIYSQNQQSNQN